VNVTELSPWEGGEVRGEGLVLRAWAEQDVAFMVSMFNTLEMDRWTPLVHPFDEAVAIAYVGSSREALAADLLQFAVTEDGGEPLGEVLLFGTDEPLTCELAYAVGSSHRGRGLAARSVRALLPAAAAAGYQQARMRIAVDNLPSQRVALDSGFVLADDPLVRRERKSYLLDLATWRRDI
jgi:RimJ/RimL family protein N-acetyltransferase